MRLCKGNIRSFFAYELTFLIIVAMTLKLITTKFKIPRVFLCRFASTVNPEHKIVCTDDGSTIVAWHPKADFPYECTKPLPEAKIEENSSVLKVKLTPQVMEIFNKKTPEQARQELMNITLTTKHRWFPKARLKKSIKLPMERPYL